MKTTVFEITKFHNFLLTWFARNKRALPWREKRNWYTVWISEIMLQQTQVQQVIPYFLRFIQTFPDVKKLATARLEKVLKIWEGLGYYSRARNLHQAARIIVNQYQGHLPDTPRDLACLPGFGSYTTHAVLSIAFNKPFAAVDGNILRVASRLFKIGDDLRLLTTREKIQQLMNHSLDKKFPGLFNEALMELGATICLPANPRCNNCPLRTLCTAYLSKQVDQYPYKSGKTPKSTLIKFVLLIQFENKFLLVKRSSRGLLAGLWEFPTYSFPGSTVVNNRQWNRLFKKKIGLNGTFLKALPAISHSYTHFNVRLIPLHFRISRTVLKPPDYTKFRWISWSSLHRFPIHRAMRKLILRCESGLVVVSK